MIDKDKFKLSIIIPCYNEKQTINIILKKVIQSLQNYNFLNYEILIVDDHSKDGTEEIFEHDGDYGAQRGIQKMGGGGDCFSASVSAVPRLAQ